MVITNEEQSRRLVDAGLNVDTADCGYPFCDEPGLPSWSMSSLWRIMYKSGERYEYSTEMDPEEVLESLVCAVARLARHNRVKH